MRTMTTLGLRDLSYLRRMKTEDVQRVLLEEVAKAALGRTDGALGTRGILLEAVKRLECSSKQEQQVVLTAWSDLFRMGVISWGADAGTPGPESAHLTEHGRETLAQASRDPANRYGYLAVIDPHVPVGSIERSYVEEALSTYAAGCDKATAVMIGAAAEAMILDLRDELVSKMKALGKTPPKKMEATQIKTAFEAVEAELDQPQHKGTKGTMGRELSERLDAYASALAGHLRMMRNEAGHPKSVDPVTRAAVHASLLVFPELARLLVDLRAWVQTSYA